MSIVAVIRAFILRIREIYDILLSKRWIRRVRTVKNHGRDTLIIQGKDDIEREIKSIRVESLNMKLMNESLVDDWETALTENEIIRLVDELDDYNYMQDQRKVKH